MGTLNLLNPLQIKKFYFHQQLQNWSYLVWNNSIGFVIDPYESKPLIEFANQQKIDIQAVLNTHDHFDHTRGNLSIKEYYNCPVIMGSIPTEISNALKIESHFTPGHCSQHYVYSFLQKHYFMGDLLFQGGVGRCQLGGDAQTLANSLKKIIQLAALKAEWYPGHDYWNTNYSFASEYDFFTKQIETLPVHQQGELTHNTFEFEVKHNIFLWCLDESNWQTIQHPIKGHSPEKCFINLREAKDKY